MKCFEEHKFRTLAYSEKDVAEALEGLSKVRKWVKDGNVVNDVIFKNGIIKELDKANDIFTKKSSVIK